MKQSIINEPLSKRIEKHFLEEEYHCDSKNHFLNIPIVFGLVRPSLLLTGWGYDKNVEIEVSSGNKQFQVLEKTDEKILTERKKIKGDDLIGFAYVTRIPFSKKEIIIKISEEGSLIYTASIKNTFLTRILSKIFKSNNKIIKEIIILCKVIRFMWKEHKFLVHPSTVFNYYKKLKTPLKVEDIDELFYNPNDGNDYREWIKHFEIFHNTEKFKYNPLISILMPVYNVPIKYLSACIDSVISQDYKNWELCIADDCSTDLELKETLEAYEKKDERIKVVYRSENGHISAATNSALEIAKGDFVGLLDNDDILVRHALNEVVKVLNNNQKLDLIYSDEDKLDTNGLRCFPYFKPDFSPDTLLSFNYICHFAVLRKSIVEKIGGFRIGYEGVQDHDLFLRFTEQTDQIFHIPKILYRWRMIPGSTSMDTENKPYIGERGIKAVKDAIKRRGNDGIVEKNPLSFWYGVQYDINFDDKVSIIIPTRDHADILETCLKSIYDKTTYQNFEIIVVDNGSQENETLELFENYKKVKNNFRVLELNCDFNYSYLNNEGVKIAEGDYIILLNNDTEVITENWIELMLGYAQQKHIGIVGAKLLYPDGTIQHAGVILGVGGVGNHAYHNIMDSKEAPYPPLHVATNMGALTAACCMFSKSKFNEISGLEEDLKVAFNDVDLNLKMLKAGYYNALVPQVKLYHHESKSRGQDTTGEKNERFLNENKYMYDKWFDEITNDPCYNPNLSLEKLFFLDRIDFHAPPIERLFMVDDSFDEKEDCVHNSTKKK